jgi:hypothetical protein
MNKKEPSTDSASMQAWKAYLQSEECEKSKHWADVDGALRAAFMAGYAAAGGPTRT